VLEQLSGASIRALQFLDLKVRKINVHFSTSAPYIIVQCETYSFPSRKHYFVIKTTNLVFEQLSAITCQ
jgi:hypothetical protein